MHESDEQKKNQKIILVQELKLNGFNFETNIWLNTPEIIDEIYFAIAPKIHEGFVFSYGAIFVESIDDFDKFEKIKLLPEQIETSRKMADGLNWYSLFIQNSFYGLIKIPESSSTEIQMLKFFPLSGGLILNRSNNGTCRIYQGDRIILHDRRNWLIKPNIKNVASNISFCVEKTNKRVLQNLLEFSYHLLSPTEHVGAILVWFLSPQKTNGILEPLQLSFMDESHIKLIFHLLAQTDGATFINQQGVLMSSGVQIRYSSKSKKIIPNYKGTRHTSSIRFSYDVSHAIVITISEDGPVSIFLNGVNLSEMRFTSPFQMVRSLNQEHPEDKGKITTQSHSKRCINCGKKSIIDEIRYEGRNKPTPATCHTCGSQLGTPNCFLIQSKPYEFK